MSQELHLAVDLDQAVARGVIAEDQAIALRNLVAEQQGMPLGSEEGLGRTSLHDGSLALLTVGAGILVGWLAQLSPWALPFGLAGLWFLATQIEHRPRMPLTRFMLFAMFAIEASAPIRRLDLGSANTQMAVGAIMTVSAMAWWWRFRQPVLVAFCAMPSILFAFGAIQRLPLSLGGALAANIGVVLVASVSAALWDISDVRRETVRSSYAGWLHLAASLGLVLAFLPLLSHEGGQPTGITVTAMFASLVALLMAFAFSRRIWLLAAIAVPAAEASNAGAGLAIAVTLSAGLALLFWNRAREGLLSVLPLAITAQLPRADMRQLGVRPTRRHRAYRPRKVAEIARMEGFSGITGRSASQE